MDETIYTNVEAGSIPVFRFNHLRQQGKLMDIVIVVSLTALLNALRLSSVTEETKLRAIATWLDAPIRLADRRARASSFEHVLSTVDLKRLSDTPIIGITSGKSDIKFSEECSVVESIFFHAWDEESAYGILASLPQLQDVGNTRYCAPYRRNCSVAVLKDNVYIIGGKDDGGKSVPQVEKVNLCNGQIYSITPMSSSRSGASAVASERCIFVFGGYDKTRNIILSSCEEYDPIIGRQAECHSVQRTFRWTALPNMPTARYASGAIYIPNVGELVVGGYEGIGKSASDLHTAELLLDGEPGSEGDRIWCTITPMLQPRCWPTGVYFDGRVFVARGGDDSVEALTLSSGHWTLISRCFVVDSYPFSMTVFSGRLLLAADNGTIYELRESTDSKGLQLPEFVWNPICKLNNVSHVTLITSSLTKGAA
ncbi:kelch protein 12 [Echinococcus multilocularis]|uniref:Kelch protein 12 n=1 Tax=Echinococcus multilocularis TaxID=6211 RepID=A0A077RFC4_ECHMU|nr:kelch protein 12 [Echinococcus multilocularis]CDI97874.1 kelch protein 12 [Echinococcus multilocularis]